MKVLDLAVDLNEGVSFERIALIGVQHLLLGNALYIEALVEAGLPAERIQLLGKSYSTSQEVADRLQNGGVFIHEDSSFFDPYKSFPNQFSKSVKNFVNDCIKSIDWKNTDLLIVLDDGGFLIQEASRRNDIPVRIVGIEQTSSGFHRNNSDQLTFPVINVARSSAKLVYESPSIAEAVVEDLKTYHSANKLDLDSVVILGMGHIGTEIGRLLAKDASVIEFDVDSTKSSLNEEALTELISHVDSVIGCTGQPSFKEEWLQHLKNDCTLVSASSADLEFPALAIREQCSDFSANIHTTIQCADYRLLNNGFPLNFDGEPQRVPLDQIQITEGLLYSAVCFATEPSLKEKEGFIDLPVEIQASLISKFLEPTN